MNQNQRPFSLSQPLPYRVTVQGKVSERWEDWFREMKITVNEVENKTPITSLEGTLADQAALQGLLRRLYYLGFVILNLNCLGDLNSEFSKGDSEDYSTT